jgi:hypothetical protein
VRECLVNAQLTGRRNSNWSTADGKHRLGSLPGAQVPLNIFLFMCGLEGRVALIGDNRNACRIPLTIPE